MVLRRGSAVLMMLACVVVVGAGIKLAAPLLNQLVLALFLATMTAPLVHQLRRRKVPTWLAVGAGLLVDVAVVVGLATLIGGALSTFGDRLPWYEERLSDLLTRSHDLLLGYGLDVSTRAMREVVDPAVMMDVARRFAQSVAAVISQILMVLLLVAFMLVESLGIDKKLSRVLEDRDDLHDLHDGVHVVHKYLLVKTGTSGATGALLAGWCAICAVDLPLLWGLLAFLLNYIPTVGSIIAAVPPMLLALLQYGPGSALAVGAGFLVVNFLIGNVVEPRWMGRTLGLSPLVVFLSMVVWGWLLGPIGALFSAPLTMMFKHWLEHTHELRWMAVLLGPIEDPMRGADAKAEAASVAGGEVVAPDASSSSLR